VWPGDLAHYVRTYHVGPDAELLAHMRANHWAVPAESIEDASHDVVRAVGALGDDLRRTLEAAGGKAGAHLSASLHSLRDWLEHPDEERTARLQSLVSSLEDRLEEALAPQRRAEEAERSKRLSKQIGRSIADRLREQGLDPDDKE
jgi:hypothetical protein